ncbi:complement receptor type 1-like isoform X2 [Chelmon rostratus]|uniref:complement receptor type 1-like isoform X2 n=1 Tax=Chelmon rostratus TaxID=109905 RepID=UPI001BEA2A65|nr:complement receptor type 1-like isoform X2 [Chelmon rostratus]
MDVAYFLLLACLGPVITAQDCLQPVGGPNMNLKDKDLLLQEFPDGTQVTFACDVGHVSAGGSAVITCTAGSWSAVRLKCERKNCGPFEEVENGHIDYSEGTEFGAKIVITCNTGYRFVGQQEPKKILCGDKGWLGRLPVCEEVTCNVPPAIADGTFSPNKEVYGYREVVQYSCQKDLTLSGSKSVSCSDDGTFQPDPPTCLTVQCEDPHVEDGDWVDGSRPPYGYKATVIFRCRSGYIMKGESTQICEINSQWSPGLPKCEPMPPTTKATTTTTTTTTKKTTGAHCEDPIIANAFWIRGSQHPHKHKATVTYECRSGFTMKGEPQLTCEDGQWSPELPTCSKGNQYVVTIAVSVAVVSVLLLTCCGCIYFGVPAYIKKKLCKRRSPVNPTLLDVKMTC